jgi:hypothetical protein
MGGHEQHGSDKGAAFMGLIGGAVFIGAILYGIVLWTNASFKAHEAEKTTGAVTVESLRVG